MLLIGFRPGVHRMQRSVTPGNIDPMHCNNFIDILIQAAPGYTFSFGVNECALIKNGLNAKHLKGLYYYYYYY